MQRNIGRFFLPLTLIQDDPRLVMTKIMGNCVVVRAERMFDTNVMDYVALSPDFDEVPLGCEAPWYDVRVTGPNVEFVRR